MKKLTVLLLLSVSTLLAMSQDKHQCAGITKKGAQCKNKTAAKYCRIHDTATPKCGAPTTKGTPCQLSVKNAGEKCWRHKG